jgi:UDP-glucose 4-epimerase
MTPASSQWRGRTVLVTGGLGFIGSALVRALGAAGATVRVLDALLPQSGGSPRHVAGHVAPERLVLDDVRSRDAVDTAVRGADTIYHVAGVAGDSALAPDWFTEIDTACLGMLHVLEAVRLRAPAARVVLISDLSVYGCPAARTPVHEESPLAPQTLHGVHKVAGEHYCGVYHRQHGVDTLVARLGWCVGPRQRLTGSASGTIANMLDAAVHDEDIVVPGDGQTLIDVLDVDDAAEALMALGLPGTGGESRIVNVSRGVSVTLRELAELLIAVAGHGRLRFAPAPEVCGVVADAGRLLALAPDWQPRPLRDTLERTLAWHAGRTDAA